MIPCESRSATAQRQPSGETRPCEPPITKRLLYSLKPPAAGEVKVWDTDLHGFAARVRVGGSRRFIVEWMRDRQTRRLTLGEYGPLTVKQARDLAKEVLGRIARGEDPAAERAGERAAPTVADLAKRYMDQHAGPRKKPASVEADERMLRLYLLPALGRAPGRRRPSPQHAGEAGPGEPVLALVSMMLNLAETWGGLTLHSNPCPRIARFRESKRERFFRGTELSRLGAALAEVERNGSETPPWCSPSGCYSSPARGATKS